MSGDIEERFKAACSEYLAEVEHAERQQERAAEAALEAKSARLAADRARDELLQVARERDLQAQLGAGKTVVYPSPRAVAARDTWLGRGTEPVAALRTVTEPEDTDYWAQHGGMCPECGISWREVSLGCPHRVVNWHPAAK